MISVSKAVVDKRAVVIMKFDATVTLLAMERGFCLNYFAV